MGMYTEIFVNVDFKPDTPESFIDELKKFDPNTEDIVDGPSRWNRLFLNGSYYTPYTSVFHLGYNNIRKGWSLLGKGDIKNYDNEIEKFFHYIASFVDDSNMWDGGVLMGHALYEEYNVPTLFYATPTECIVRGPNKNFI